MPKIIELVLPPEVSSDLKEVVKQALRASGGSVNQEIRVIRRSLDARHRQVRVRLQVAVYAPGETPEPWIKPREFAEKKNAPCVAVIGSGPAGLFAALKLIESGIRPIVLERGKDVRSRRRDLAAIHKEKIVHSDSNYCFGEGGAGTYSDGKLYTRSTKRGDVHAILQTLVQFGASPEILVEAHPHIGTNKLPGIIAAIRNTIVECGGEVHFETAMEDIEIQSGSVTGVITRSGQRIPVCGAIVATGHSARDVFHLFKTKNWAIEFKSFALGVRVEHPQSLIDRIQYHCEVRGDYLPPAAYSLVEKTGNYSAFSFCMCPGGIIAPCATSQEEVVTNGWSPSKRNNPWANSGIVVPVEWKDLSAFHSHQELAGIAFQSAIERTCWESAGRSQSAPAQRLTDFVEGRLSTSLPACSYQPGTTAARLDSLLPDFIAATLKKGFRAFGQKMPGYYTDEAIVVGPESRTSSPVRIPRNPETLQHTQIKGLFPCGEGAGYAGGIVSAAIDGERAAEAVFRYVFKN